VPSIGQALSAVIPGTTNNKLLACVAPRCRINANNSKGAPAPVITATQPKLTVDANGSG
jgi:hypothetical protein